MLIWTIFILIPLSYLLLLSLAGGMWYLTHRTPSTGPLAKGRIAIIVPAHNESEGIENTLASLKAAHDPFNDTRIIVIADNCTDNTAEIAQCTGARVLVRDDSSQRGKGYALNHAFDRLKEDQIDIFAVIDADSVVSDNFVFELRRTFFNGAQALQVRYQQSCAYPSGMQRLRQLAFAAYNTLRPMGRQQFGLSAGILGNGFALTKETLHKVPYLSESIVEDLEYHLMLVEQGLSVQFNPSAQVIATPPPSHKAHAVQRSRWIGGRISLVSKWVPRMLLTALRGKIQIWEPLLDLLTPPLSLMGALTITSIALLPQHFSDMVLMVAIPTAACYLILGCWVGQLDWKHLAALALVPLYIGLSLLQLPMTIYNRVRKVQWQRTPRRPTQ